MYILVIASESFNFRSFSGIGINLFSCVYKLDEWSNFQERTSDPNDANDPKEKTDLTRQWVSYRGQTLFRTGIWHFQDFPVSLSLYLDTDGVEHA